MLINYLQPVVKEMLKGWLLSPGGGGSEELSLDNTGRLRPKGVPFSGFQVMDDSQWRFLAQQSVTLRCIDMNGCDFVPTLKPYQQQQSYSGLRSPGRSSSTYLWNDPWVQTFNIYILCCAENRHCKFLTLSSGLWLAQGSLALHKN